MDLEIPVMDGLECSQNVCRRERERSLAGHVHVTANAWSLPIDSAMHAAWAEG